jgi:hypothetical protein
VVPMKAWLSGKANGSLLVPFSLPGHELPWDLWLFD